jgi:hypothetical protein
MGEKFSIGKNLSRLVEARKVAVGSRNRLDASY